MKRPLLSKIIWFYVLLTAIIISFFIITTFTGQTDIINENALNKIKLDAYDLNKFIEKTTADRDFGDSLNTYLDSYEIQDYLIYNSYSLEPIFSSTEIPLSQNLQIEMINTTINKIAFGGDVFTFLIKDDVLYGYIAYETIEGLFVLNFVEDFSFSKNKLGQLYFTGSIVSIGILLLHLIFAGYVYLAFFRRINKIEEVSIEIKKGNYNIIIDDNYDDEVSRVVNIINEMTPSIAEHMQIAKGANPLSSLPGNVSISKEIQRRMDLGTYFAVVYTDLDNFKAFNDYYGVHEGDRCILFTRDCLLRAKHDLPNNDIFVGHEGGDDFIAVMDYGISEKFAKKVCEYFDAEAKDFYNPEDQERGYILGKDRKGKPAKFNFVSNSVAIVSNRFRTITHMSQLIDSASGMKKKIKLLPNRKGSAYLEDARKDEK